MKTFGRWMTVILVLILALVVGVGTALAEGSGGRIVQVPSLETAAQALLAAGFMATVANRLVAGLVEPIFVRFKWDKFYLMYVAWGMGGLLVWVTHVNIFVELVPDPLTGQILTAVVAGGGANILHDLFDVGERKSK